MPMIHRKPSLILLFWPTVFPSPSSLSWATSCCSTDPESISSLITCLHVSQSREQTQSIAFLLKPRNEAWVKGKHPCSFALAGGWMGGCSGVKCQFLYSHLGGWALILMLECGDTFGLLFSGLLSTYFFSSVQFGCSVVSDSWQPRGLQHTRPPCPSSAPRVYSNSCPSSRWCHPTISSFVIPFSSCLQSFPASGSFQMSQFFASGGQSIGVSASTSVLPMNIQDWFPLGLTDWLSLQSKGLSRVFSHTTVLRCSAFFIVPLSHPYMTTGETTALTGQTFVGKVMSLLFNTLSRLSFPNLLAYWMQNFHSINFQDLEQFNWNSITSTSFVHSDAS